uniref:Ig-like domain-containing protein n=1 Tax=Oryzias latipes TaxID=8090 RepID=A0A3P9HUT4_ORYLA
MKDSNLLEVAASTHHLIHLMASFSPLFPGLTAGDSISPDQDEHLGTEGKFVSIKCNYETDDNFPQLYWYKHDFDLQAPQFILWRGAKHYKSQEFIQNKRYESRTTDTSTELIIRELTLADTALYYCGSTTVIQSVEEAVQKPEDRYGTTLLRGGKWFSKHSFISD